MDLMTSTAPNAGGLMDNEPLNQTRAQKRLLTIPCKVCGDYSTGKHYTIFACDGCAGFFKRSIRKNRHYVCSSKDGSCVVDKSHRNQCRACRLQKCEEVGMNREALQVERGPRNSIGQKQQIQRYFAEAEQMMMISPPNTILNVAVPNVSLLNNLDGTCSVMPTENYLYSTFFVPNLPLTTATVMSSTTLSASDICELAARLIFINVQWAKTLPSFSALPYNDQLLLIEDSWTELLVLGCAQVLPTAELSILLSPSAVTNVPLIKNVQEFQNILLTLRQFQIDKHEFDLLRSIIIYKPILERNNGSPTNFGARVLSEPGQAFRLQEEVRLLLRKYIDSAYPEQPQRFSKLLMLLPALKHIYSETIEDLFFRNTIGPIPIVRIISDMYKSPPKMVE